MTPLEAFRELESLLTAPQARETVRGALRLLERTPQERHPLLCAALAVRDPAFSFLAPSIPEHALQQAPPLYPSASLKQQARLVLGESPVALSGGELTRREAHDWLSRAPDLSPAGYLLWAANLPQAWRDEAPHSVPVARWLLGVHRDPARRAALTQERTFRGPHGEAEHRSFLSVVSHLTPRDLSPSVRETCERACRRLWRAIERAMKKRDNPLQEIPAWWVPAPFARLLRTPAELVAEGQQMDHCVAQYAPYVKSGKSHIVSLCVGEHRSTVELTRDLCIKQHHGPRNQVPSPLCERALQQVLKQWRAKAKAPAVEDTPRS